MKKLSKFLAVTVVLTTAVGPFGSSVLASNFTDLNTGANWAQDSIVKAAELGLMNGDENGKFRPLDTITRQEFAAILARTLKLEVKEGAASSFSDVSAAKWGQKYIEAVHHAALMNGDGNGAFRPDAPITREELAVVLVKAVKGDIAGKGTKLTVADKDSISAWAKDYVQAVIEMGYMKGDGTNFNPKNQAQRQEAAVLAVRLAAALASSVVETAEDGSVTINGVKYQLSDQVKGIINKNNSEVLKGAKIKFEAANNTINKITYLEITNSGKAAAEGEKEFSGDLVLDGNNGTVEGDLKISADFISVRNLTVSGNFEIGKELKNDFYSSNLKVVGKTIINGGASNTVVFDNANLGSVEVNKPNVHVQSSGTTTISDMTIESDATITADQGVTIPKLTLTDGANNVEINTPVTSLVVNSHNAVTISGSGDIASLSVAGTNPITLNTTGKIDKLEVSDSKVKLTIKEGTNIANVVIPQGSNLSDVISNYDQVKGQIQNVNGTKNPDAVPVTPPGGGGSSINPISSGLTDSQISTDNKTDTLKVTGVNSGDIIKVYSSSTGGSPIATGTAGTDGSVTVNLDVAASGVLYVSHTESGKYESGLTAKAYTYLTPTVSEASIVADGINRVTVSFKVNKPIDLSNGNGDIQIAYYRYDLNGNKTAVKTTKGNDLVKNKLWDGYLNSYDQNNQLIKYGPGAINNTSYQAVVPADTTLLTTVDPNYATMNYVDGKWVSNSVYTTIGVEIKVMDRTGTASNTATAKATKNYTGDDALAFVKPQDFGVMQFSGVNGYSVGFELQKVKASQLKSAEVSLYNGSTLLQKNTSNALFTDYPDAAQLSSPFDVTGKVWNGDWTSNGPWNGTPSDIPTKAVIVVTDINGNTYTVENTNLTGDLTQLIPNSISVSSSDQLNQALANPKINTIILSAEKPLVGQFKITGDVTIVGRNGATIQAPDTMVVTGQKRSGENISSIITVKGTAKAKLENVIVDGAGKGQNGAGFMGIYFENAGGEVKGVTVKDIRNGATINGMQEGIGIYADNNDEGSRTITVTDSTLSGYQKGGMVFKGDGLTVNVSDNTVKGAGKTNIIAQNGIQLSYGATGSITNNTITDHVCTTPGWEHSATGILVWKAGGGYTINSNTFANNDTNVYTDGTAIVQTVTASNGKVTIVLDQAPMNDPSAGNFAATLSINNGTSVPLVLNNFAYNKSTHTVTFDFAQVAQTSAYQSVVVGVSYNSGAEIQAPAFKVHAPWFTQTVSNFIQQDTMFTPPDLSKAAAGEKVNGDGSVSFSAYATPGSTYADTGEVFYLGEADQIVSIQVYGSGSDLRANLWVDSNNPGDGFFTGGVANDGDIYENVSGIPFDSKPTLQTIAPDTKLNPLSKAGGPDKFSTLQSTYSSDQVALWVGVAASSDNGSPVTSNGTVYSVVVTYKDNSSVTYKPSSK